MFCFVLDFSLDVLQYSYLWDKPFCSRAAFGSLLNLQSYSRRIEYGKNIADGTKIRNLHENGLLYIIFFFLEKGVVNKENLSFLDNVITLQKF